MIYPRKHDLRIQVRIYISIHKIEKKRELKKGQRDGGS